MLDAFLQPSPIVTDESVDNIVQLIGKGQFTCVLLLASVEGTIVFLEIPLQPPPPRSEFCHSEQQHAKGNSKQLNAASCRGQAPRRYAV